MKIVTSLDFWVVFLLLTAQKMPQMIVNEHLKFIFLVFSLFPIWLVILKNFLFSESSINPFKDFNFDVFRLFILLVMLVLLSLVRGYEAGSVSTGFLLSHFVWWTTVLLLGAALFLIPRNILEVLRLRRALYYGLGFYIMVNAVLYFFGVVSVKKLLIHETMGKATVLSFIGIDTDRVTFATASGPAPFGAISGLVVVLGLMFLFKKNANAASRFFATTMFVVGVMVLLLTDSRAAMLWVILAPIVVSVFYNKNLKFFAPLLPYLSLLLPSLLLMLSAIVADFQVAEEIGRSRGSENISTLSNRSVIWGNITSELGSFSLIHVFGYGARGQVASGIGLKNEAIFENDYAENPDKKSAHNFALQYILDVGYTGLLVLLILFHKIIKVISKLNVKEEPKLHLLFFVYILLAGTTDVICTIYVNEIFTIILLLITSFIRKERLQEITVMSK